MVKRGHTTANARPVRRRASAPSGGGGGYAGLIIVALVIAGAVAFWEPIRGFVSEKMNARPSGPAEPKPVTPPGETPLAPPVSPKPSGVAESEPDGRDDERAKALFSEATERMRTGEFATAVELLSQAQKLKLGPRARVQISRGLDAAKLFVEIDKRNALDVEGKGAGLYRFHLKRGGEFRGVVKSETLDTLTIAKDNGITVTVKRSEVQEQKPVPKSEFQKEQIKELADRRSRMDDSSLARWKLARFALRKGLRQEAAELLLAAAKQDPELPKTVREGRAREVLRDWVYYKTAEIAYKAKEKFVLLKEEYENTEALKMARNMLAEEQNLALAEPEAETTTDGGGTDASAIDNLASRAQRPTTTIQPEPEPQTPRPSVRLKSQAPAKTGSGPSARADAAFERGMALFGKGATHPDARKGREMIAEALRQLDVAIDQYEELLKTDPGNDHYRKRLDSARRKKYWAGKFRRLS